MATFEAGSPSWSFANWAKWSETDLVLRTAVRVGMETMTLRFANCP